jgi:hypothetical protein
MNSDNMSNKDVLAKEYGIANLASIARGLVAMRSTVSIEALPRSIFPCTLVAYVLLYRKRCGQLHLEGV